jgi:SAM-dependent methyltransferase
MILGGFVAAATRAALDDVRHLELGCGANKREGFFGIDIAPGPAVDLVLDIEREALPFADSSIERVYSSHTFEHLEAPGSPIQTLREIMRVAKHGAEVEIWTPFGKSDDALLFGHKVFYTETHWKHVCFEYDDFYFGENVPGRFIWRRTQYLIYPEILERLRELRIPLDFALTHMTNIALEFGVFLEVDKTALVAERPQIPVREFGYRRNQVVQRL